MPRARQVTGVGPRHAFIFDADSGGVDTVDQVVGVDISAARTGTGLYTITHNLGKTAYCATFTAEMAAGNEALVTIVGRSGNTMDIRLETVGGSAVDAAFVHGVIYD